MEFINLTLKAIEEAPTAPQNATGDARGPDGAPGGILPVGPPRSPVPPAPLNCSLYAFVMYTVIAGLLCALGVIGNTVAFVVFLRDAKKTSATFLFQGLSVADTLLLTTAFPVYSIVPFVQYTGLYPQYQRVGYAVVLVYVLPLAFLAQTCTIWLTVLVAVNRYIAVCLPYRSARLCSVGQARKQMAAVLVLAVAYNVPKFIEARLEFVEDEYGRYAVPKYRDIVNEDLYFIIYGNIMYTVFLMALPLLCLTVLNFRLIRALARLRKKRTQMKSQRQQQDNNITVVLIVVIIVFTVCQTPALVTQILWSALDKSSRLCGGFQFYFSRASNLLVIANSAVNFLIYFGFNSRFRHVLICVVCRWSRGMATMTADNHLLRLNGADDHCLEPNVADKTTTI